MKLHEGIEGLKRLTAGSVLTIGNFDGMHLGHARILQTMRDLGSPLGVATFEPHPLTVIRPELAPPRLSTPAMKQKLLEGAGVDELVILPPTQQVLGLTAEQFWAILRDDVRPSHLVEGSSFNFGKDRTGNIARLREWSAASDVKLHVVDAVRVPLLDLQVVEVSSSLIRWLISYGRVRDAAICLGGAYVVQGVVGRGHGRGRQIGVPTANLNCGDQLIPGDGVYVGQCTLDGKAFAAAVNIGTQPTFGDNQRQVEAHLLDFDSDLYGRTIDLELHDWLREQMRFAGVEALKQQIARDLSSVRQYRGFQPSRAIAQLSIA